MVIGLLAEGVLPLRLSSGFHGITGPLPHYSMVHLTGLSFGVYQPRRSRGAGQPQGAFPVIAFAIIHRKRKTHWIP